VERYGTDGYNRRQNKLQLQRRSFLYSRGDKTMRYALICGTLLIIGAVDLAADEADDRMQIQATRDQWMQAFFRGDTETMDRLETDDFIVIAGKTVADKKTQLAGIKKAVADGTYFTPGIINVDVEVKTRFAGNNVAVVSGHVANKFPSDDKPRMEFAVTEVWQRTNNGWRAMHLHFHPLDDPIKD
jgi:ketosteroid isomerase-like protein